MGTPTSVNAGTLKQDKDTVLRRGPLRVWGSTVKAFFVWAELLEGKKFPFVVWVDVPIGHDVYDLNISLVYQVYRSGWLVDDLYDDLVCVLVILLSI